MTTNQVKTKVLFAYHVDDTELQSIKDGWPEDICLCMIVPGVEDVRYMLFEKSERVQALNNIADEYHMSSREMPVSPRVEGFAKCDMSFTQEQKLQGIIDRHPTLLTDAQDYKLNYQDRKNQSIPPVLNADEQEIVFFDEAFPEEMPKSAPEASEEMSAVDDALINRISIALTEGETFGQEHRVSHMPIEDILETKEPVEDNISTSEDGAAEDEVGTQEASVDADLQQEEVLVWLEAWVL